MKFGRIDWCFMIGDGVEGFFGDWFQVLSRRNPTAAKFRNGDGTGWCRIHP